MIPHAILIPTMRIAKPMIVPKLGPASHISMKGEAIPIKAHIAIAPATLGRALLGAGITGLPLLAKLLLQLSLPRCEVLFLCLLLFPGVVYPNWNRRHRNS